jgi:hypothetical protein
MKFQTFFKIWFLSSRQKNLIKNKPSTTDGIDMSGPSCWTSCWLHFGRPLTTHTHNNKKVTVYNACFCVCVRSDSFSWLAKRNSNGHSTHRHVKMCTLDYSGVHSIYLLLTGGILDDSVDIPAYYWANHHHRCRYILLDNCSNLFVWGLNLHKSNRQERIKSCGGFFRLYL